MVLPVTAVRSLVLPTSSKALVDSLGGTGIEDFEYLLYSSVPQRLSSAANRARSAGPMDVGFILISVEIFYK